ncbi:molybdenum cofactor guanylyltransferase MobA [Marinobacterium jannaschii]|uniref:molybdenum cofactor guanylyltransferase MobA n=1 Tax=Marinobacterium jannaschii TaxID=64970 RepID=UPI0006853C2C|nr:molybdenum cofactor guanylyltransferase MobA [Marinobacterium jannaschii]
MNRPEFKLDAVILAGGQGQRMGGCDKGLVELGEQKMVQWTLDTVRPVVSQLIISCNRNQQLYHSMADQVVSDQLSGFPGPLAGIQSALNVASGSHLLVLPCDTPWVGKELIHSLAQAAKAHPESIIVAELNGRMEPLHAIIPRTCAASLESFLQSGQRAVRFWYQQFPMQSVAVAHAAELANINDREQLAEAEQNLRQRQHPDAG